MGNTTNGDALIFQNSTYQPCLSTGLTSYQPWGRDTVVGYWDYYRVVGIKYLVEAKYDPVSTSTKDVIIMVEALNYQDEQYPPFPSRTLISASELRRVYEQPRPNRKLKRISSPQLEHAAHRSMCKIRGYVSCRKMMDREAWLNAWTPSTSDPGTTATISLYTQAIIENLGLNVTADDITIAWKVRLNFIVQWRMPRNTTPS